MSFVSDLFGGEPETPDYSGAIKAAEFTPWNVTTGYGTSVFDKDAKTATYTLDPRLAKLRDIFYGGAEAALPTEAQTQFANLVAQYGKDLMQRGANLDVNKIAQDYYTRQLELAAPGRAQEESRLADTLFKTGRTGAGVGVEGGYVNPEQYALLKAREEANAQLGLTSMDRARAQQKEDILQGLGLYGTGTELLTQPYSTASTLFGLGTNFENLGAGSLTAGINMGSAAQPAANQVSQLLAGQENARVNAANQPGFFGSLLGTAANLGLAYAMPGIGKAIGTNIGSWIGGTTPSYGNVSPGIQFGGSNVPSWYNY